MAWGTSSYHPGDLDQGQQVPVAFLLWGRGSSREVARALAVPGPQGLN